MVECTTKKKSTTSTKMPIPSCVQYPKPNLDIHMPSDVYYGIRHFKPSDSFEIDELVNNQIIRKTI